MATSRYLQVDVFTSTPFHGNALAVILDAEALSGAQMQRIATWMNLSETAFVLPPTRTGADYRVRIFTPRRELPFAGHPSVGTAHALLEAGRLGGKECFVQECGAGLLPVRVLGSGRERRIFVCAPRPTVREVGAGVPAALLRALGAPLHARRAPLLIDNGPSWLIAELGDADAVRALAPDFAALEALCSGIGAIGVSVFGRAAAADHAIAVRAFCPGDAIPEDPVTGSANAAIGDYLHRTGQLGEIGALYRASQGRELGRDGYVDVEVDAQTGDVDIGGQTVTIVDGSIVLQD